MKGVTTRENVLEDTLAKAERFWYELKSYQKTLNELRLRIEGIQPALGEPATIEQQRNTLLVCRLLVLLKFKIEIRFVVKIQHESL